MTFIKFKFPSTLRRLPCGHRVTRKGEDGRCLTCAKLAEAVRRNRWILDHSARQT